MRVCERRGGKRANTILLVEGLSWTVLEDVACF